MKTSRAVLQIAVCLLANAQIRPTIAEEIDVDSPDGANRLRISIDENAAESGVKFSVVRRGQPVVEPSRINAKLSNQGWLATSVGLSSMERNSANDSFELPWGKTKLVHDHYNAARLRLRNRAGVAWEIEARDYDDGVAWRYGLPDQGTLTTVRIADEASEVRFAGAPTMIYMTCESFTTSHENTYDRGSLSGMPRETLLEMPLLASWPGVAAAVTEARLRDFAGMYLMRDGESTALRARLSPRVDGKGVVAGATPVWSPWRVVLLGDHAGKLFESNLLLCLNDPPEGDYSWAEPGKATWHWWNGTAQEDTLPFKFGLNFDTHKYYIDFCARNGIKYHSVVADHRTWYEQISPGYGPGEGTDILTPRPELELPRLLEYAREQGVGIRLWVHWQPLSERLEEAFAKYEEWGIRGLMVDFMDRDDQEMVDWQMQVLESAARHKLHIQFHGSYKFSGEQRTFPHLFNREGVLNLEYLKWSNLCDPDHNVNVAYTRALAGPPDYHAGGFRSISRAKFEPRDAFPNVLGTRCHHLAMYVVFENPMPMVSDTPSSYEGQPGFGFLREVPTTWDETRFVMGEPGEYVVLARRAGDKWYLGGMADWTARKLTVPLSFLGAGPHGGRIYVDGSLDEELPNEIRMETREWSSGDSLEVELAPGGGFVGVFE